MVAILPSASFTVSSPRKLLSWDMCCFRFWLGGCQFLSLALNGARSHVMILNSRRDRAVGAWAHPIAMLFWQNWHQNSSAIWSSSARHAIPTMWRGVALLTSSFSISCGLPKLNNFVRTANVPLLSLHLYIIVILLVGWRPAFANFRSNVACDCNGVSQCSLVFMFVRFSLLRSLGVLSYIYQIRHSGTNGFNKLVLLPFQRFPFSRITRFFWWLAPLTTTCGIFPSPSTVPWLYARTLNVFASRLLLDFTMSRVCHWSKTVICASFVSYSVGCVRLLIILNFFLLKCILVEPATTYLSVRLIKVVEWSAPGCDGWFPNLWDTSVVHLFQKYHATFHDRGKSA